MKNAYELAENILKSKPDKNIELKSSDSFASIELYGTSACKKVQDTEFCECFHLENESGTGMITLYHVFPGIDLVYNDIHMEYCNKEQKPASSVMEINYCMEGRSGRRLVILFFEKNWACVRVSNIALSWNYHYA